MQGVCLVGIFIRVTRTASRSMGDERFWVRWKEIRIRKYFGKRGEHVVQENLKCVRRGLKRRDGNPVERHLRARATERQRRARK